MFENYTLEYRSDQMRREYERAIWELAQNQKQMDFFEEFFKAKRK